MAMKTHVPNCTCPTCTSQESLANASAQELLAAIQSHAPGVPQDWCTHRMRYMTRAEHQAYHKKERR